MSEGYRDRLWQLNFCFTAHSSPILKQVMQYIANSYIKGMPDVINPIEFCKWGSINFYTT